MTNHDPAAEGGDVFDTGTTAAHPAINAPPVAVAPTSQGSGFNTVSVVMLPVACWRVDDLCFDFGASFPGPQIAQGLAQLEKMMAMHPPRSRERLTSAAAPVGCPLSIFAHADSVGEDAYNKQLSGRRATAIYGLLTRDTSLWETLYSQPLGTDAWGEAALLGMARSLYDDEQQANQAARQANTATARKALYLRYMEQLCDTGAALEKEDFLAKGADPGGKGDYQGCGEFNPALVLSQKEEAAFAQDQNKHGRNLANTPNRRVMVLIFRRGSHVNPQRWPCPRASEDATGCHKRFWKDGDARRNGRLPDQRRHYQLTEDTYGCRFYDRMSNRSPCERLGLIPRLQWSCFVPSLYASPELLAHATDGDALRFSPTRSAFADALGGYKIYDLAALADDPQFRLQGMEPGRPISPNFMVDQLPAFALPEDLGLLSHRLSMLMNPRAERPLPATIGETGPDMLDMCVTFDNPGVSGAPSEEVQVDER